MKDARIAVTLFVLMFIQYGMLTLNTYAISSHTSWLVFGSDLVISLLGFTIFRHMVEATKKIHMVGYALGGAIGAQIALLLTHAR